MSNIDYKKRTIILSFICAFVIIALVMTIISMIQDLHKEESNPVSKHLYATVLESGNNYIKVSDIDNNDSFMFVTKEKYDSGDLLSISYIDDNGDIKAEEIDIIASKEELESLNDSENLTSEPTTSSNTTTSTNSTTTKTTKKVKTSTTTSTKKITISDNDVVNYFENEYNNYSTYEQEKSIPEKAKSGFIKIIDFIFYDGEIKGKKFNELTSSAKAKVVYYALLIDSKIDSKWPNYKNTIKTKASDLKAKLIAKYMDVTSSICENHSEACNVARNDFSILKKSLSLTWDVIKDATKYGYGKFSNTIKNWYETWRDKA